MMKNRVTQRRECSFYIGDILNQPNKIRLAERRAQHIRRISVESIEAHRLKKGSAKEEL
jgi:hypothetical protein